MAENTQPQDVQPGGRSSRGPNPDPGGEEQPGGLLPPYEGRTTDSGSADSQDRADSVRRQMAETKTGRPGATASPADEQPVSEDQLTDEVPESPKGVGSSSNRGGHKMAEHEGKEPGREDGETKHESERPTGTSTSRDMTGINPQK